MVADSKKLHQAGDRGKGKPFIQIAHGWSVGLVNCACVNSVSISNSHMPVNTHWMPIG